MLTFIEPSAAITNARGMVARSIEPVSASLPSMLRVLKFDGKPLSGSRRLPPWRRSDTGCGLMSAVLPNSEVPPTGGGVVVPPEQPVNANDPISIA